MKTKLVTFLCIAALGLCSISPASASQPGDSAAAVTDVILVRPLCFAATIIGSALFVVALPVSIPSRSVKKTGRILVAKPARATFTRPVGDFGGADMDD